MSIFNTGCQELKEKATVDLAQVLCAATALHQHSSLEYADKRRKMQQIMQTTAKLYDLIKSL